MLVWTGFALAVVLLLLVSRKNLALGMALATLALAAFTMVPSEILDALWNTVSDPSVLLLAGIVSVIPLIGGVMESSGEMDRLVANLRIGIRPFLALAPGLLGMLPMPGGALLSAPLIEKGAGHAPADVKAAANVWFRHVLLLVYPLGPALIASAKIADLEVYAAIPYLIPAFILTGLLGYLFLLRRVDGQMTRRGAFSLPGLAIPLAIILVAPVLDLVLKRSLNLPVTEIATFLGVSTSLVFAMGVGRTGRSAFVGVVRRMRPWKYALIILAMFAFLNVFEGSGVPEKIAALTLPPVILCVVIGFLLGLITGRIQAPMSIVIPIYVTAYGPISAAGFALTYLAIFLGYIVTPVHPCISVSLEYFGTPMAAFLRRLTVPVAVTLAVAILVGLFVF